MVETQKSPVATASPVYVRASACNRVGCGAPSYAVPAGASPRRQVAGVPFDVAVAPAAHAYTAGKPQSTHRSGPYDNTGRGPGETGLEGGGG